MWIFAKGLGFLSIVADDEDENYLHVRARKREHLERVTPGTPDEVDAAITETPDADYRWRARVARDVIADIVAFAIFDIDYDSHVKEEVAGADRSLYLAMVRCWDAMVSYQSRIEEEEEYDDPGLATFDGTYLSGSKPGLHLNDESDPQEASQEAEEKSGMGTPDRPLTASEAETARDWLAAMDEARANIRTEDDE